MTELERRVCSAWRQASADLGVQFSTPFVATAPNAQSHAYLGLVHHFGRGRGTAICLINSDYPKLATESSDHYLSLLGDCYADYDRQLFIETLKDWGWCGPSEKRPGWLTEPS